MKDNPNIFSFGGEKPTIKSDIQINEFEQDKNSSMNAENTDINPFENNVLTEIIKTNSCNNKNNYDEEIRKKMQKVDINIENKFNEDNRNKEIISNEVNVRKNSQNIYNNDINKSVIQSKSNFDNNKSNINDHKNNNFYNNFSVINPNNVNKVNINSNIEVNHNNFQILNKKDTSQEKNRCKSNSVSVEKNYSNNKGNQSSVNNYNNLNGNNNYQNMNNYNNQNLSNMSMIIGNNNQNSKIQSINNQNQNNNGNQNSNSNDNKRALFNVLKQANEIYNKAIKHSAVFDYVQAISLFNESKELTKSVYNQLQSDEKTKQQMNNFIKAIDTQLANNEMFRKNQFVYSNNNKNIKCTTDFTNDILRINKKDIENSNSNSKEVVTKEKSKIVKDEKDVKKGDKPEDNINIPDDLKERILAEIVDSKPQIKFSDIIGLESAKQIIKEIIILPSIRPDLFTGLRSPPRGMLLFGPPGTGKTMLAKAVATECKCTFFNISASSLTSKYVGESEKLVRALFTLAFSKEPSVIFIDELDSLLSKRGDNDNESSKRLKTEFLVQFDGVGSHPTAKVLIIGATNRPQELDVAVVRRLPKRVYVGAFNKDERKRFMKFIFSNSEVNISDEEYDILAEKTENYTNSDLKELCREASYGPIREIEFEKLVNTEYIRPIEFKDVINATKKVRGILCEEILTSLKKWDEEFGALS